MNKEEFCSLPPAVALAALWTALLNSGSASTVVMELERTPKPQVPRPPRFDRRIYQRKGYQWASEMDLRGLQFWQGRYAEGAAREGNQYAEKDAKSVKELGYWIAWRRVEPNAVWSGERDREQVTASAPHAKPFVYERQQPRGDQLPPETQCNPFGDEDGGELPF